MRGFSLQPLDTWFFRDSTPFSSETSAQYDVGSVFPPFPATVAGALRAALARRNGWSGRGSWDAQEHLRRVLGDGPLDLGRFSLLGPLLLRDGAPLFPVPRHLVGLLNEEGVWQPRGLLSPSHKATLCDLGEGVSLPAAPDALASEVLQTAPQAWITWRGLEAVLRENLPSSRELVFSRTLWSEEARIGLKREEQTRTAEEGMLYSSRHIRLSSGISLGVLLEGIPGDWASLDGVNVTLGGESRVASCTSWSGDIKLSPPGQEIEESGRFLLLALTPTLLTREACLGREPLPDLPGARVVSACIDRPVRVGGWNSLARSPLPLQNALPAGSVLFCDAKDSPQTVTGLLQQTLPQSPLIRLGKQTQAGFGLMAVGAWSYV